MTRTADPDHDIAQRPCRIRIFRVVLHRLVVEFLDHLHCKDVDALGCSTRQEAIEGQRIVPYLTGGVARVVLRSEEHTCELQSLMRKSYAVFCLKKNNNRSDGITTRLNTISSTA